MSDFFKKRILNFLIIFAFGLLPALLTQYFVPEPQSRHIHVRNFRYGKDPDVIRCNRGDTLHLTLSTDDTGHSFYLEEFDIDAKVSPGRELIEIFKVSDPTDKPSIDSVVVITAKHPGLFNYLVSRSNFRCHVWCGPMHAFEHGKLIILPNTLLIFSLGCLLGILILWILGFFRKEKEIKRAANKDLLEKSPFLKKLVKSRWPQLILQILAMAMVYVVVLISIFGTKMSGRNLGVLLMWAVWLFLLVAILTPLLGRIWCTICPLPVFGDLIQRGSALHPREGSKKSYKNKYAGLFLKWPKILRNNWMRLVFLLTLTTFTTTLVAIPKVTGFAVIALLLLPTLLAFIFEHRAFCTYLCPVSAFVGPFSRMSKLAIRNKSDKVCERCKAHYCEKGSPNGWACPYGLNVGEMDENSDCGLCLECTRSCLYNNVTLYRRPFASELGTRKLSEAWLSISIFVLALVYSIVYQGHWAIVRDYVNILDKANWGLFGVYTLIVWSIALLLAPALMYILSRLGVRLSGLKLKTRKVFLDSAGALLPMGMMLWISFVVPMLFVNVTFILQSASDPLGWGWDIFGTASLPWHQFLPRMVPWIQAALILFGLHLSLRNLKRGFSNHTEEKGKLFRLSLPIGLFITGIATYMIFFYTN